MSRTPIPPASNTAREGLKSPLDTQWPPSSGLVRTGFEHRIKRSRHRDRPKSAQKGPPHVDDGLGTRAMATSTQSNDFDAEKWVTAIHDSLQTVACETLGVEQAEITRSATHQAEASKIRGAYISLVEGDFSALLGLRGSQEDCEHLARMMLELGEDEDAEDEDVRGTISELANIIAGLDASSVHTRQAAYRLGVSAHGPRISGIGKANMHGKKKTKWPRRLMMVLSPNDE